ncbi:MAG: ferritin-like domain-containing protein [Pseudomonadota bacterium]|uniref:ferritin-like domain-containing protein n=1 Tax=Methyloversatilis sp. TaxID=2569862 RepID=UPI002737077D|nr:ferritin-like domain-containing protein [Methyloversatilis sp.]MDP3873838.1 ferritin-like domain-containing protein [Methyloversatilis sp.]
MNRKIFPELLALLMCEVPEIKCAAVAALWADWQDGTGFDRTAPPPHGINEPGRPARPELVEPSALRPRGVGTREGHAAMIHAICHIEFTAINLALDAAWRFRDLPDAYLGDWLRVAADEARHFGLLRAHLQTLGHDYGDFPAHAGLWDMARRTADDALTRMALVPRVLEARGLDATPPIMDKLRNIGDAPALAILDLILSDEITHVAIGDRWFRHVCAQRGLAPEATFLQLFNAFNAPRLQPPVNEKARLAAGFSASEIAGLSAQRRPAT